MAPPGGPSVSDLLSQIISAPKPNMHPVKPGVVQSNDLAIDPTVGIGLNASVISKAGAGSEAGAGSHIGAGVNKPDIASGSFNPNLPFGVGMAMGVPIGRCPRCSATMGQLRDSGLLGCPTCYEAFLPQLLPLLQRYHEGGGFHCGKAPKRLVTGQPPRLAAKPKRKSRPAVDLVALAQHIQELRAKLVAALIDEDYRNAAIVRDELVRLGDVQAGRAARGVGATDGAGGEPKRGGHGDVLDGGGSGSGSKGGDGGVGEGENK